MNKKLLLTKKETHGLLFLITIIGFLIYTSTKWDSTTPAVLVKKCDNTMNDIYPKHNKILSGQKKPIYNERQNTKDIKAKQELFTFDPNTISSEEALSLGIPKKVFNNIQKYKEHGGKIKTKEKFKNIYGLTLDLYARLEPFIQFETETKQIVKLQPVIETNLQSLPKESISFEINHATIDDLESLKGIGQTLATRIIKYRNALGGFKSISQLKEVYGLPDSTYQKISIQLTCDGIVNKIDLNKLAEDSTTIKHPYLSNKEIKTIKRYKQQHNAFEDIDQLHSILSLDKGKIEKMKDYLVIE